MVFTFDCLPDTVVLAFINNWLGLPEIAHVDSAFSNLRKRSWIMELFRSVDVADGQDFAARNNLITDLFLHWVSIRGIQLKLLSLRAHFYFDEIYVFFKIPIITKRIEFLSMGQLVCSSQDNPELECGLIDLINSCVNLKTLEMTETGLFSDHLSSQISTSVLSNLTSLNLEDAFGQFPTLLNLLCEYGGQLRTLKLTIIASNEQLIKRLFQNCPLLTDIDICVPEISCKDMLHMIQTHCEAIELLTLHCGRSIVQAEHILSFTKKFHKTLRNFCIPTVMLYTIDTNNQNTMSNVKDGVNDTQIVTRYSRLELYKTRNTGISSVHCVEDSNEISVRIVEYDYLLATAQIDSVIADIITSQYSRTKQLVTITLDSPYFLRESLTELLLSCPALTSLVLKTPRYQATFWYELQENLRKVNEKVTIEFCQSR